MLAHPRSFPKPDLSQLKVLRSLEVGGWGPEPCADEPPGLDTTHTVVMEVFSTITSPVFSEFVVVVEPHWLAHLLSHGTLFIALRAMNEVRPFKLAFLVLHRSALSLSWEARQVFERDVGSATAKGLFDFLSSPPTVRIAPRHPFHLTGMESRSRL